MKKLITVLKNNTKQLTKLVLLIIVISSAFGTTVLARLPDEDLKQVRYADVRKTLDSAYCFEPTASRPGTNVVVMSPQSYKEVECTSIFGTGPFSTGYQFVKENGCYFVVYGASACDKFPNVGLPLLQYLQQKYPNVPNVGQGSSGQGSVTPTAPETTATPESTPTETTAPSAEDTSLSAEELAAQSEALRQQLSKGTNSCGKVEGKETKTVFNFDCSAVKNCSGLSGDEKRQCDIEQNPIYKFVTTLVRFITFGIGIIITLSIVISGIQYTTAQGDTNTVHKARLRIFNAVIALLLYIFAFAILNYLVPGGLIN